MVIHDPEYGNCIANLACSILNFYRIEPPNATLKSADELLKHDYRNVVLLLLDGMGSRNLEDHLTPDGFFRKHLRCSYSSTFPPTTVAATTAIMSGLYPNQSAWLGWTGYFEKLNRNVVYFTNKDDDTGEKLPQPVAHTFLPYTDIRELIGKTGVNTHWLTSWISPECKTYSGMMSEIERLCTQDGRHFIYAYWEEPDNTMHKKGVLSLEVHKLLQELETETKQLAEHLEDTLLLITADHGLIDSQTILLSKDQEIMECLVRAPSIEARAMNLFVKEEMKQRFESLFYRRYGDDYKLFTMEHARSSQLFGTGKDHPELEGMLGNYLAVATGHTTLRMKDKHFIGEHAGMTADEMLIPLIAVESKHSASTLLCRVLFAYYLIFHR